MGITFKSDGKSETNTSSEPLSEKFTQRPKDEDFYYEEHDITETRDYKKGQLGPRFYFMVGILLVFLFFTFGAASNTDSLIDYERDKTLAEQRELEEQARKSKKTPFDEA